jgi:hypothetical protein
MPHVSSKAFASSMTYHQQKTLSTILRNILPCRLGGSSGCFSIHFKKRFCFGVDSSEFIRYFKRPSLVSGRGIFRGLFTVPLDQIIGLPSSFMMAISIAGIIVSSNGCVARLIQTLLERFEKIRRSLLHWVFLWPSWEP